MSCMRSFPARNSMPVMARSCFTIRAGYAGSAFRPVPTAVPPIPRSRSASPAWATRSALRSMVWPYATNSWPSRIGVASCKCVRPDLRILSNALPFVRNARARRPREHSVRRLHDRGGGLRVETPGLLVHEGGGLLDPDDGVHERREGLQMGDGEILAGALGLDPVERVRQNFPISHLQPLAPFV